MKNLFNCCLWLVDKSYKKAQICIRGTLKRKLLGIKVIQVVWKNLYKSPVHSLISSLFISIVYVISTAYLSSSSFFIFVVLSLCDYQNYNNCFKEQIFSKLASIFKQHSSAPLSCLEHLLNKGDQRRCAPTISTMCLEFPK